MYKFTSESVSEGHPDKVADLISDRIADFILDGNINNRTAIETLVTTNMVTVAGEYKSTKTITNNDVEEIVKQVVKEIGYDQSGFSWKTLKVYNELHGQSQDIALGTDNFGAGDQGIMFGYACKETPNLMPMAINYCHEILKELTRRRKTDPRYSVILPDSKSQITVNYSNLGEPVDIDTVLVSTQHVESVSQESVYNLVLDVVQAVVPADLLTKDTKYIVNPTGRFVIGGPDGDTGLTGRKIIVDTYGGAAPHGGGAFSGKDGSKVDRSAAYMCRWIAKNIVDFYPVNDCLVQLSYVIGLEQPASILIKTDGKVRNDLEHRISTEIDLTPLGIIDRFRLGTDIKLSDTTNYGHFGKDELPWEQLNL
jgi:S-adenosylmethionine synthetase